MSAATHIIDADGTNDRVLPAPEGSIWNALATWSNDGTRIFVVAGHSSEYADVRPAVIPADGSKPGFEIAFEGAIEANCCSFWMWSPDDSTILGRPTNVAGQPNSR